ncbi:ABC transporter ATP-binding protein [Gulosibacter sp. 10]|uniref:ABC transporter ATP-binding protein n=1 Tax=Gulosibacter sp. 10 TaxID=1255570 RepID=UPI00097F5DAA|nr:ABC transporter ATP-binding protein [Gulosibacter sp. 10]SJM60302.1 Branched-chain amino acid transport ATP-binding protein LivF (TC 3.A.1.4.1) [Gulosibacter sp. 10]
MLEINDLHVQYGKSIKAVQGASFSVGEGEIVSLVGQNGAGKSSVLKAVAGLAPITAGTIAFEDSPLASGRIEQRVRRGIAYVPEERGVFAKLTVAENLRLGTTPRRDRAEAERDIEAQLARFPILRKYWGKGASWLSGGEQQQLVIARALVSRPRLLLLDEPTLGLAPIVVDMLFDFIGALPEDGVTVMLVEQNAVRAIEISDRAYVVQPPGRIIGQGGAADLAASPAVVDYLGFEPATRGEE